LIAPISQGEQVGELVVSFNDQNIATLPLIALENAAEAGFISKMIDTIKLLFR
jgi:D-alanyl-D-alanine carboxypeptidase (penicillin-binding protein 5/6)